MEILKNHQFLRLWGNQVLLQVAFNMSNFTALLILAEKTNSPLIQALFYTALTVPAIIFGLIAGPIVDIVERKALMLITDALLAVLFLVYIFVGSDVTLILLVAFLTSSVARFFIPAEAATIPLVVTPKTLNHANSFFLFTLLGSVLLGYAIAGPLIQFFGGLGTIGEKVPFILSSIFLVIGFILRLSLKKIDFKRPDVPPGSIFAQTFHLFWQTVVEVKSNHKISLSILLLVFIELMMGLLSVVLLGYVREYLHIPLTSISYIFMGPLVLGLLLGVLLLETAESLLGIRRIMYASLLVIGLILLALGGFPYILDTSPHAVTIAQYLAIASSFFIGIFIVLIAVTARTVLQVNAAETMHGRIFSFLDVMIAFVTPIPVLVTGLLADSLSIRFTLVIVGVIVVTATYFAHNFILRK